MHLTCMCKGMIGGYQIEIRKGEVWLTANKQQVKVHTDWTQSRENQLNHYSIVHFLSDTKSSICSELKMDLVVAEFYSNWCLVVVI